MYLFFEYPELLNQKQFGIKLENYFIRQSRSDLSIVGLKYTSEPLPRGG